MYLIANIIRNKFSHFIPSSFSIISLAIDIYGTVALAFFSISILARDKVGTIKKLVSKLFTPISNFLATHPTVFKPNNFSFIHINVGLNFALLMVDNSCTTCYSYTMFSFSKRFWFSKYLHKIPVVPTIRETMPKNYTFVSF